MLKPQTEQLQQRSKDFAVRIVKACDRLPSGAGARVIANQVLRSATSVAANYRAACRARSMTEFAAKIGIVVEEADETVFWLELLRDAAIVPAKKVEQILDEAKQLLAIFAASKRTSENKLRAQNKSSIVNHQSDMVLNSTNS